MLYTTMAHRQMMALGGQGLTQLIVWATTLNSLPQHPNIHTDTADTYGVALNRDGSIAVYTDYNYGVNVIKRSGTSWSITQRFIPDSSIRWQRVSISEDGDVILLSVIKDFKFGKATQAQEQTIRSLRHTMIVRIRFTLTR